MANLITRENVFGAAGKFLELAAAVNDVQAVEHIQAQLAQFRVGLFRIVVVGEVKKGKSSFINALLGDPNLLPTSSDVATSTVYKLMYGTSKKIKVFTRADTEDTAATQAPIEISEDQLKEYGTEDGNPNNKKKVDFIGIQVPHPLLKSGVAIIDTPGLGGLFEKHRDITWRYIPSADAIFFVLDSVEAVASKTEMECLAKLRNLSPLIFFIQTKTDLVEEEQWRKWRDRNLEIISAQLKVPAEKLIYFPVSAKLKFAADANHSAKHLDRSGYSALLYFLYNKLLAKKDDQLGRRLLASLSIEAAGIHRKLTDHLQIAVTETKEGLDHLEKELIETKTKYEQWKGSEFQRAVTSFQDKAADLKRKTREALQLELDPSPYSKIVSDLVSQVREANIDPRKLNEEADGILALCIDKCSQTVRDIQGQHNDQMHDIVNDFSAQLGKSLSAESQTPTAGVAVGQVGSLHMQFNGFEEVRNVGYGMMFGSGAASAIIWKGVALAGISLGPPGMIAAGVAVAVAGLVAAWKASTSLKGRRQEEAIAKLTSVLSDAVRRAQGQALRQFDTVSIEYEKSIRDSLRKATTEMEREMANKIQSLSEQRQRSGKDAKEKAESLKRLLDQTNEFLSSLARQVESVTEKS